MKIYPPRHHQRDELCECGHKANVHEAQMFRNTFNNKLYTGRCYTCMCPKFSKEQNDRGVKS